MCRWLAYSGSSVLLEELLYVPAHSLIDQSLHSRLGRPRRTATASASAGTARAAMPGVFRSTEPAWNDRNLRELAAHVRSQTVFAHIRASTGTAVQQTNCHPFRHGRWLWMHNGAIHDFPRVKRELTLAVDEALYPELQGSTDSELFSIWRSRWPGGRPTGGRGARRRPDRAGRRAHGVDTPSR